MKFNTGPMYLTPGAIEAFDPAFLATCTARHLAGDWGDVGDEDKATNDGALIHGERLVSAYKRDDGKKLWIITERDRSATTLLLPDEY